MSEYKCMDFSSFEPAKSHVVQFFIHKIKLIVNC